MRVNVFRQIDPGQWKLVGSYLEGDHISSNPESGDIHIAIRTDRTIYGGPIRGSVPLKDQQRELAIESFFEWFDRQPIRETLMPPGASLLANVRINYYEGLHTFLKSFAAPGSIDYYTDEPREFFLHSGDVDEEISQLGGIEHSWEKYAQLLIQKMAKLGYEYIRLYYTANHGN